MKKWNSRKWNSCFFGNYSCMLILYGSIYIFWFQCICCMVSLHGNYSILTSMYFHFPHCAGHFIVWRRENCFFNISYFAYINNPKQVCISQQDGNINNGYAKSKEYHEVSNRVLFYDLEVTKNLSQYRISLIVCLWKPMPICTGTRLVKEKDVDSSLARYICEMYFEICVSIAFIHWCFRKNHLNKNSYKLIFQCKLVAYITSIMYSFEKIRLLQSCMCFIYCGWWLSYIRFGELDYLR